MDVKTEIESLYGKTIYSHQKELPTWIEWYAGFSPSFHRYNVPKGNGETQTMERMSMGMAKAAAENYANLLMNEKTMISLDDEDDNATLKTVLHNLYFNSKTNEGIEKEYALGGASGYLSISGADESFIETDPNEKTIVKGDKGTLHYEMLDANQIYPLNWQYGEVLECAFASFGSTTGVITLHTLDEDGNYVITEQNYIKDNNETSNWKRDGYPIHHKTGSKVKMFSYVKPNMANNKNLNNPTGISIFANAIDSLKSIDAIYDGYYYEFILGKKRVFASAQLSYVDSKGMTVETFDPNDVGIYVLPTDDDGKSKLTFSEGQLRSDSYSKALNDFMSMFSYQCGFGKGFFSFGDDGGRPIQTATAIVAQNMDLFRNIQKQEINIEKYLREIIVGIIHYSNEYTKYKFKKEYEIDEINIRFDDSIFEDKESQKEADLKEVEIGVMSKAAFREKWHAETEEIAYGTICKSADYIAKSFNALLPVIQANIISPKEACRLVYGKEIPEIVNYISKGLEANNLSIDDLASSGFGSRA